MDLPQVRPSACNAIPCLGGNLAIWQSKGWRLEQENIDFRPQGVSGTASSVQKTGVRQLHVKLLFHDVIHLHQVRCISLLRLIIRPFWRKSDSPTHRSLSSPVLPTISCRLSHMLDGNLVCLVNNISCGQSFPGLCFVSLNDFARFRRSRLRLQDEIGHRRGKV